MSVLHSLYYGNLNPADRPYAPNSTSANFRNLLKQQAEVGDYLNSYTDTQVQKWFFSYCELQAKISAAEQEELFAYAFRLGARMYRETFASRDGVLQEDF